MKRLLIPIVALLFAGAITLAQDRAGKTPSKNLLNNSSFEEALGPDGLPEGWSLWVQADGKYKAAVVDGGRTGKKCLKIDGAGIRAVVNASEIKLDRGKRYALRGWVKVEGDNECRALITFNYLHDGKWLGLPEIVKISPKDKGWQLIAKTDRADQVPDASVLVVSCNLEGKGTAWFDDLELVAFDRKNLPDDFETRYGPSNQPAEFNVLQRRVGAWDTQTTIKPGVWVPDGAKSKGVETFEWVLGKKF